MTDHANPDLNNLRRRLGTITALEQASMVLMWDQATYMPQAGGRARGEQLAALKAAAHEQSTDLDLGRLLDRLENVLDLSPVDAALVRVSREDFDKKARIPAELVAQTAAHEVESYQAWEMAREANDFSLVAPKLEKTVGLSRAYADCFPGYAHIADPLIDIADPGQTVSRIVPLFDGLRQALVPLVQAVTEADAPPPLPAGPYDADAQLAFSRMVAERFGYDFSRGRLDRSAHPFTISFSIDDVRITTRVRDDDPTECLFSTFHEAGHGMYEQGIDLAYEGTPVAAGTSSGLHESQSRLWENLVGRSRPFWNHFYGDLQATFPVQLGGLLLDDFYRSINRVSRSLVRTGADELTYNLHVMLRFDLELALLTGDLAVADLPDAWVARMEADLGLTPPDHNMGVLQDVHWFAGQVGGAFQGYTLGNIYCAQLFDAALTRQPELAGQIEAGDFAGLLAWLTEHVYRHGRALNADQVVLQASGKPATIDPYVTYLDVKYRGLYGL
jgi:carboxypeptidase Taq